MCSEDQWRQVKTEYVTGDIPTRTLADKHSVPYPTLRSRSIKEDWAKLREDYRAGVDSATQQKIAEIAQEQAEEIAVTVDYVRDSLKEVAERCMQTIPVLDGNGEPTGEYKFDSSGANRALELLGKHLKMFTDKLEQEGSVKIEVVHVDAADPSTTP
jgi:hypothetical protein